MARQAETARGVALLALTLCGSPAGAQLSGRAILAWSSYDAADLRTSGLHQLYDLRLSRALGDRFQVRLTFRGEDDASGSTYFDERRSTDYRQLQPGARLLYSLDTLQFQADWDRVHATSGGDGRELTSDRTLDRAQARLSFRPEDLPGLTIEGSRRSVDDAGRGTDLSETRGTARIDYAWRGLQASAYVQSLELDDVGQGFTRDNRDVQGSVGYADSFWSDRLVVQASANVLRSRIEERAAGGTGARVPNPVAIAAAFQANDDTPEDGRDRPLTGNPLLVDGDLTRPAGAPLGPEAATNLNLAIDLGRFAQVDELRVVARDGAGNPVATGGAVVWDLYTSDDFVFWRPVTAGALTTFDAAQGFWSVSFPQATVRYLKLVSFFVNAVPTELSEILAFYTTELAPGAAVATDFGYVNTSGYFAFRPHRSLTLTWSGLANDSTQMPDLRPETTTSDRDQRVTALWQPRRWLDLELQRQWRTTETTNEVAVIHQDYDNSTAILRVTPSRRLTSTVEFVETVEQLDGRRVDSERLFLRTVARFWDTLEVNLDVGEQRQDFVTEGWTIATPTLTGALRARVTSTLQWTATASLQENRVSGEAPAGLERAERDVRWWSELFWRPSGQLGLGARFGRATRGEASGVIQSYTVQWQPFPGGAIRLSGTYDQDLDPLNDRQSRRLIFSPAWKINRSLTLNASYLALLTEQKSVRSETSSVQIALTANF